MVYKNEHERIMRKKHYETNKKRAAIIGHKYYMKNKEKIKSYKYNRRNNIIKELKINGCAICGYIKCNESLDFHHINSEDKKFNITKNIFKYTYDEFVNELNKCILLCKNCHNEIHYRKIGE